MSTPTDAAFAIIALLDRREETVATAESLTGGLVCSALVDVPGASTCVLGGVVAYATAAKSALLDVDGGLLAVRGAVDAEVARQLADGARAFEQIPYSGADGIEAVIAAGLDAHHDAFLGADRGVQQLVIAIERGVASNGHSFSVEFL